jgi:putative DNA primase/helicase
MVSRTVLERLRDVGAVNTINLASKRLDEKGEIKFQFLNLINSKNKDWASATELLTKYILDKVKIFTTKDDQKSEMWIYKDGVYIPQGRSEVKSILREILEEQYSSFVFGKVIDKIEPDTFIEADKFFSNNSKELMPVENGILNIFTLELTPFTEEIIFFNKLPVKFDIDATCPKIEKFLKDVLSNEEDINVFYELAGFSLLKEYTFEKAFMLVGGGRNGKSKSILLLKKLVGPDNVCSVPLTSLSPNSFSVSELFGKLLNLAGDISNQDFKDTSTFKTATGRDIVGAQRKFQRPINFHNYAKFVFACNDLPMVYDLSKGFWSRWVLLEFPYYFAEKEEYERAPDKTYIKIKDPDIIDKITTPEEMSGLLNQALIGLKRLITNGDFSSTKGSEEVKSTWIRKANSFVAFCFDNIEEDSLGLITKKDLRKRYSDYCKNHKVVTKSDVVIKNVMQCTYGASEEKKDIVGGLYEHVWLGVKWKA